MCPIHRVYVAASVWVSSAVGEVGARHPPTPWMRFGETGRRRQAACMSLTDQLEEARAPRPRRLTAGARATSHPPPSRPHPHPHAHDSSRVSHVQMRNSPQRELARPLPLRHVLESGWWHAVDRCRGNRTACISTALLAPRGESRNCCLSQLQGYFLSSVTATLRPPPRPLHCAQRPRIARPPPGCISTALPGRVCPTQIHART